MTKPLCAVNGCDRVSHCRGWCTLHYERWRTHGNPEKVLARRRLPRRDPAAFDAEGKTCSTCNRYMPLDAYFKRAKAADGLMYRCKDCCRDAYNKRYADDPNFRERRAKHHREHYDANAEKIRNRRRRNLSKYGMTMEQFEVLNLSQNGLCAICGEPPYKDQEDPRKKRLSVDHNHETGLVRGLLCDSCNIGIGMFRDSPERLQSAIDYLKAYGA